MATFRTIFNRVLTGLGEDQLPSSQQVLTDKYHLVVAEIINQVKEEVEDAHQWRSLFTTHVVTLPAGEYTALILGANERSRLLREYDAKLGEAKPVVLDITDADTPVPLRELDNVTLTRKILQSPQETSAGPNFFAVGLGASPTVRVDTSGNTADNVPFIITEGLGDYDSDVTVTTSTPSDGSDAPALSVYPASSVDRTFLVRMVTPQNFFDTTQVNVLDTHIIVPQRPIILGSIWYALEERGEELGQSGMFSEERWRKALDDAIGRDSGEQGDYELVPV